MSQNSLSSLPSPLSPLCCALLLSIVAGCGTGEYERRLSERNSKMQAQAAAKFGALGNPQELAGTGVSISVPRLFANPPLVEPQADARRVKPGVVTIPGLKLTQEGTVQDSEGGQIPYYVYVGATPGPLQNVANTITNELNGKGGKVVDWVDFKAEAANGPATAWRKLRFEGNQEFYYKNKAGQEQFSPMPGVLEIYLHDAGAQIVVVAWRMPTSLEQNVKLPELASLVAGSVNVKK